MSLKPKVRVKAMSDSLPRFANHVQSSGYVNQVSGLGTGRDKGAQGAFSHGSLDVYQIDAAYRSSWLARKGVDTPALDMLRQGWNWGLGLEDEQRLSKEWKRLDGDRHNRQALIWSRLHGGAAIYIGTEDQDLSHPHSGHRAITKLPHPRPRAWRSIIPALSAISGWTVLALSGR